MRNHIDFNQNVLFSGLLWAHFQNRAGPGLDQIQIPDFGPYKNPSGRAGPTVAPRWSADPAETIRAQAVATAAAAATTAAVVAVVAAARELGPMFES